MKPVPFFLRTIIFLFVWQLAACGADPEPGPITIPDTGSVSDVGIDADDSDTDTPQPDTNSPECPDGFEGVAEECLPVATACTENPCGQGTCTVTGDGYACLCPTGQAFNGETCVDDSGPDLCAEGEASCDENATCVNTVDGYDCVCGAGFEGDGTTCIDIDGCAENPCHPGVSCTDVIAPGTGFSCGDCPAGYEGDGITCTDIDECDADPCDANAFCTNLPGTFRCTCDNNAGYFGDGLVCFLSQSCDPDSPTNCHESAGCEDAVGNGAYQCICLTGFEGDGESCADVDECARGTHSCPTNSTCHNLVGFYECDCNEGFEARDGTCVDIDGCADHPCFPGTVCNDVPAPGTGFTCGDCPAGYEGDGITCTDIDGCADDPCYPGVSCTDVPAPGTGFVCGACPRGFEGDGITCTDIDECDADPCDANATCQNSEGSFTCTCNEGFDGDGFACFVPSSCDPADTSTCDANADCVDPESDGVYACRCRAGFEGDGQSCVDINECSRGTHSCSPNAQCSNTVGGFDCACDDGFAGDGTTCTDINECTNETHPCSPDAACTNSPGSYTCTCGPGFEGDGLSCNDIDGCADSPCYPGVECSDVPAPQTGFVCGNCPAGMSGDGITCWYTIAVTAGTGGQASQSGSGSYAPGEQVTLTATPATGHTFTQWRIGGQVVSTQNPLSFQVNQSAEYEAVFTANVYSVNVSCGQNAQCSGAGNFPHGYNLTINVTPNPGYVFSHWTDESNNQIQPASHSFTVTSAKTFTATIVTDPNIITLVANPPEFGVVSQSGLGYAIGQQVTISATPNHGYRLAYWTNGAGTQITENPHIFHFTAPDTYTAHFEVDPNPTYSILLSANPTEGGTVTQSGTAYQSGDSVTITATANPGYAFVQWIDANSPINAEVSDQAEHTFTITENVAYTAVFSPTATVTIDKVIKRNQEWLSTPQGNVEGAGSYPTPSWVTVSATAPNDLRFWAWADENDNVVSLNNPYEFQVTGDRHLRAVYVAKFQHVAPTGNDATARGTTVRPWRTIEAALSFLNQHGAQSGDEIRVQAGLYGVDQTISLDLFPGALLGGYSTNWGRRYQTPAERNEPAFRTEIRYTGTNTTQETPAVSIAGAALFEGFIVSGTNATGRTLGARLAGGTIRHNTFHAGGGNLFRAAARLVGYALVHDNVFDPNGTAGLTLFASNHPDGAVVRNNEFLGGMASLECAQICYANGTCEAQCGWEAVQLYENDFRPDPTSNYPARFFAALGDMAFFENTFHPGAITAVGTHRLIELRPHAGKTHLVEANTISGSLIQAGTTLTAIYVSGADTYFAGMLSGSVHLHNNTIAAGVTAAHNSHTIAANFEADPEIYFSNNTIDIGRRAGTSGTRSHCGVRLYGTNGEQKLRNNIFFSLTDFTLAGTTANVLCQIYLGNLDQAFVQNNLVFPVDIDNVLSRNGTGFYTGNVRFNPQLVDQTLPETSGGDWRPSASSPNAVKYGGLDLSAEFADDKDGLQRTATIPAGVNLANGGQGWSIGAYEWP